MAAARACGFWPGWFVLPTGMPGTSWSSCHSGVVGVPSRSSQGWCARRDMQIVVQGSILLEPLSVMTQELRAAGPLE